MIGYNIFAISLAFSFRYENAYKEIIMELIAIKKDLNCNCRIIIAWKGWIK